MTIEFPFYHTNSFGNDMRFKSAIMRKDYQIEFILKPDVLDPLSVTRREIINFTASSPISKISHLLRRIVNYLKLSVITEVEVFSRTALPANLMEMSVAVDQEIKTRGLHVIDGTLHLLSSTADSLIFSGLLHPESAMSHIESVTCNESLEWWMSDFTITARRWISNQCSIPICVRSSNDSDIFMNISVLQTPNDLVSFLCKESSSFKENHTQKITSCVYTWKFRGKKMNSQLNLRENGVVSGSIIELLYLQVECTIELIIKSSENAQMNIRLSPLATIETLKRLIQSHYGIDINQQRLVFSGTLLDADRSLLFYEIYHRSIIHLMICPLKGEKPTTYHIIA